PNRKYNQHLQPTDPLARHLQGLQDFAQAYTEATLGKERTPARLLGIIRKVDVRTDVETSEIHAAVAAMAQRGQGKMVDCMPGCDYCCYRSVSVTVPEVLAIQQYISEKFSEEEKASLRARVDVYRQ